MKKFTRYLSIMLAFVLLLSAFPLQSFAAANLPNINESAYLEFTIPAGTSEVYADPDLQHHGSAVPYREYTSKLFAGDKLLIVRFLGNGVCYYRYPVSNGGYKYAYSKVSTLFGCSTPQEYISSCQSKVTTYIDLGNTKTGSTAIGDEVFVMGSVKGGAYKLIIYSAANSSGRKYKCAFIPSDALSSIRNGTNTNTNSTQALSHALYKTSGGYISCGFDGYVNTKGRHEGIDFVKGQGSAVYSLTDGVVTRVSEGYNGSNGLSTIAIYYPAGDKTIVYLHANPLDNLYKGQQICKGQQIATEAWRGVSSASGTHTHVEVRSGYRTGAAKSVNDYTLENANPSSFWNGLGYSVK